MTLRTYLRGMRRLWRSLPEKLRRQLLWVPSIVLADMEILLGLVHFLQDGRYQPEEQIVTYILLTPAVLFLLVMTLGCIDALQEVVRITEERRKL